MYTLFPIILFVGVSLYALMHIYRIARDMLTASWVSCVGKIETYDVKKREINSTYSLGSYAVIVLKRFKYSYSVKGTRYEGVRVSWAFPESMLEEVVKSSYYEIFKNAPNIKVFYNPKRPSQSVVLKGLRVYHLVNVLPALFVVMFIAWFVHAVS